MLRDIGTEWKTSRTVQVNIVQAFTTLLRLLVWWPSFEKTSLHRKDQQE